MTRLRRLAWRHFSGRPGSGMTLVLTIAAALGMPALPLLISAANPALPSTHDVALAGGVLVQRPALSDAAAFDSFQGQVEREVRRAAGNYLGAGAEVATSGALRFDSVNGQPPPAGPAQAQVVFASDLAAREELAQGELAHQVDNSLQGTVSMRADAASQVGLRLGDVACLGLAEQPGQPRRSPAEWCARLVGLWRPSVAGDPYWAHMPAAALYTDRADFFVQQGLMGASGGQAGRWYASRPDAVTVSDAADFKSALGSAAYALTRARSGSLQTDLGPALDHYAAVGRRVDFSVRALSAALALVAVLLVVARATQFFELRRADLSALAARGWPMSQVRRLMRLELSLAVGLAVALATLVATTIRVLVSVAGAGWLQTIAGAPTSIWAALLVTEAATLTGALLCLGGLTVALVREQAGAVRPGWAVVPQRLLYVNGVLPLPAAVLLLLPGLLAVQHWWSSARPGAGGYLLLVALLALLSGAAIATLPAVATTLAGLLPGPAGTVARRRLGARAGWWGQGLLLVLASATTGMAASWLAALVTDGGNDSLVGGLALSLVSGTAVAALAAVAAAGLLMRAGSGTTGGIDGLIGRAHRRAVQAEIRLGIGLCVAAGAALGPGLAWAASARLSDDTVTLGGAGVALAVAATAVVLITAGLMAGRLAFGPPA